MNNDVDGFGSFWFWLAVVANYCQIESYEMNKQQISNDEIMKELQRQNQEYLEIIKNDISTIKSSIKKGENNG